MEHPSSVRCSPPAFAIDCWLARLVSMDIHKYSIRKDPSRAKSIVEANDGILCLMAVYQYTLRSWHESFADHLQIHSTYFNLMKHRTWLWLLKARQTRSSRDWEIPQGGVHNLAAIPIPIGQLAEVLTAFARLRLREVPWKDMVFGISMEHGWNGFKGKDQKHIQGSRTASDAENVVMSWWWWWTCSFGVYLTVQLKRATLKTYQNETCLPTSSSTSSIHKKSGAA